MIWSMNLESDPLGASWGPGVRRDPTWLAWGWNRERVARVQAPTLLVSGELDTTVLPSTVRNLYSDLGAEQKVYLEIACTGHRVMWETRHEILFEASLDWLLHGSLEGATTGEFSRGD